MACSSKAFCRVLSAFAVLAPLAIAAVHATPRLRAQSASGAQSPAAQTPSVQERAPRWQIDAGGKAVFEVASVKKNLTEAGTQPPHANVALDATDAYTPAGGLFSVGNFPLSAYMAFAYKLSTAQVRLLASSLPKWAVAERFDIEARASIANPTKDQMRLMLQSLLVDRFKIANALRAAANARSRYDAGQARKNWPTTRATHA